MLNLCKIISVRQTALEMTYENVIVLKTFCSSYLFKLKLVEIKKMLLFRNIIFSIIQSCRKCYTQNKEELDVSISQFFKSLRNSLEWRKNQIEGTGICKTIHQTQ
jgi:hypothetical protein